MESKLVIDLPTAKKVAAAAESEAKTNGWDVAIALVDDGGHLMYLQRESVQLGSIEVAISKAKSALMFRRPTKSWEEMVASGLHGYLALPGVLPIEGGMPLAVESVVVGAIGVSGVKPDQDGQIARAGVDAL